MATASLALNTYAHLFGNRDVEAAAAIEKALTG
jgi:hypothetical protein